MENDRENEENLEEAIDPPVHDGGSKAVNLDSSGDEAMAIDPPSHDGGG